MEAYATFHTNNIIESYHSQLKSYYLTRSQNKRADRVIYRLTIKEAQSRVFIWAIGDKMMFSCRSFEDSNVYYNVTIDETCNYIKSCDCAHMVNICKHRFLVSCTHYIPFRDVKRGYRTVESDNHQQEENDVTVEIVESKQDYTMIVERQEKARWDSLMEETKKVQVLPKISLSE